MRDLELVRRNWLRKQKEERFWEVHVRSDELHNRGEDKMEREPRSSLDTFLGSSAQKQHSWVPWGNDKVQLSQSTTSADHAAGSSQPARSESLKHVRTFGVSTHSSSMNAASAWQPDAGNAKASTGGACGRRADRIARTLGECMVTGSPTVCACKYGKNGKFGNSNPLSIHIKVQIPWNKTTLPGAMRG